VNWTGRRDGMTLAFAQEAWLRQYGGSRSLDYVVEQQVDAPSDAELVALAFDRDRLLPEVTD